MTEHRWSGPHRSESSDSNPPMAFPARTPFQGFVEEDGFVVLAAKLQEFPQLADYLSATKNDSSSILTAEQLNNFSSNTSIQFSLFTESLKFLDMIEMVGLVYGKTEESLSSLILRATIPNRICEDSGQDIMPATSEHFFRSSLKNVISMLNSNPVIKALFLFSLIAQFTSLTQEKT